MSTDIDWLGITVFEYPQVSIIKKITLQGVVVGHSARCLIHGDWYDISAEQAALINDPIEFCHKCQQGKPETDWRKPSAFAQSFIDALDCGLQPPQISVNLNDAIEIKVPERFNSSN